MADRKEMVKPQGPGPGEGAGGGCLWDCLTLGPIPRLSASGCPTCLMLDSLAGRLGPHPGPTLGKILNFLELGPSSAKQARSQFRLPRLRSKGRLWDLTAWVQILEPPPASCVPLKKLLSFSEPPFLLVKWGW